MPGTKYQLQEQASGHQHNHSGRRIWERWSLKFRQIHRRAWAGAEASVDDITPVTLLKLRCRLNTRAALVDNEVCWEALSCQKRSKSIYVALFVEV
jgi:hypothetical protein